ncbi:MAG: carboxylate-amine ligase [Cyanobacteria bacterium CRU_2_1]|nr:carboxylate-amine ligase [Cyanobacteria bacterium RU_5_0]NJR61632.1 carboxylate-amine ligase [Cyanobacteria bacterium CRU_2_1]
MTCSSIAQLQQVDRFHQLKTQLHDRWQSLDTFDQGDGDILVIPSLSLDSRELQKVTGVHLYEERLLFSLIRLRNPRTRLIYVTSQPIHPSVIDYYLQLLPGVPFSHARDRLLLFCTYDGSLQPLTQKILQRPRLLERLRRAIRQDRAYMTCFNSTHLERELALQLDIPMLAVDPDLLYWGTKSGSRQIFAECDVPHPDGSELVWNADDLALAAAELWERQPNLNRMVVKLNEGFSGGGNALLDLRPIQSFAPGLVSTAERASAIYSRFECLRFQSHDETWEHFSHRIVELGAIVESFIEGEVKRSPSVQGCITPMGEVEILSTHDQILGGPDGQVFLGCTFPADESYRLCLQEYGLEVGRNLAAKGALERFSVDFIAVRNSDFPGGWDLHAIEINLRKGGTTHPFMTLKLLTYGRYDYTTGLFYNQQGTPKYYVATDNLQRDHYKGLIPSDLMDVIAQHQLHFNSTTETGTVFHLIGCLSQFGKLGLTSIGNSPEEAEAHYERVIEALDRESQLNASNFYLSTPTFYRTSL